MNVSPINSVLVNTKRSQYEGVDNSIISNGETFRNSVNNSQVSIMKRKSESTDPTNITYMCLKMKEKYIN